MEVTIDTKLYQQALTYAQQQGLNLTSVIENFLVRFVGSSKNTTEQAVPDVVLSLLGAGESVADEDLNARTNQGDRSTNQGDRSMIALRANHATCPLDSQRRKDAEKIYF